MGHFPFEHFILIANSESASISSPCEHSVVPHGMQHPDTASLDLEFSALGFTIAKWRHFPEVARVDIYMGGIRGIMKLKFIEKCRRRITELPFFRHFEISSSYAK